ncbi:MAG: threonine-phosphate decarboxylase CobD [Spirochaetota bacterium]|nr:threonine-phosphate decarboxylase CobD [Spirochaetota bacterium]
MKDIYKHGGNIKEVAKKYNLKEEEIIDFSASINPLGLPTGIKKTILRNIKNIIHYPDPQYVDLKYSILEYLNTEREVLSASNQGKLTDKNILVGNGSSELIYLAVYAIKSKRSLLISPGFSEYERALHNVNSKINYLILNEEDEFNISANDIIDRINNTDIIFLCNPNNPTGRIMLKEDIVYLLEKLQDTSTILVLDEAFIDMADKYSLISMLPHDNLYILRSLTKFFSIPGLRLGYGIGSEKLIGEMENFKQPWSVNQFADLVGQKLFSDRGFIIKTNIIIEKERNYLFDGLSEIKSLKPYKSYTNFILVKINASISSIILQDRLAQRGILIRDCSNFRALNDSFIRVAVRNRNENKKLLKELRSILI